MSFLPGRLVATLLYVKTKGTHYVKKMYDVKMLKFFLTIRSQKFALLGPSGFAWSAMLSPATLGAAGACA